MHRQTGSFYGRRGRNAVPKRWFSKLGPLTWYRDEWLTFNLTVGQVLIARIHRGRFGWMVALGGTVVRRSIYGLPTVIDPLWRKDIGGARRA